MRRLSASKAEALAGRYPQHLVIGSDQVAVLDGDILGKPHTPNAPSSSYGTPAAMRDLPHRTGPPQQRQPASRWHACRSPCTSATSTSRIRRYVEAERPLDCAGSFKAEGLGVSLFRATEGGRHQPGGPAADPPGRHAPRGRRRNPLSRHSHIRHSHIKPGFSRAYRRNALSAVPAPASPSKARGAPPHWHRTSWRSDRTATPARCSPRSSSPSPLRAPHSWHCPDRRSNPAAMPVRRTRPDPRTAPDAPRP